MNCNTTHYRANSSSVPGDPTLLVSFSGTGKPSLMVGRLPVRTQDEAKAVVAKLIRQQPLPASLVSVVGPVTDSNFSAINRTILEAMPKQVALTQIEVDTLGDAAAKTQLQSAFTGQHAAVEYLGHGNSQAWSNGLLNASDARDLEMKSLPLFLSLTCLNGYFHDVRSESLAEVLLKSPSGGAIAAYASSGLSSPESQAAIGAAFLERFFSGATLGEAVQASKSVEGVQSQGSWILFGDPTARLVSQDSVDAPASGCGCSGAGAGLPLTVVFAALAIARRRRKS